MEYALVIIVAVALIWFVSAPLRRREGEASASEDPALADLEARKEAKYREIRDAELDHAAGKLSEQDFRRQDAELRREAIAILKEIDAQAGEGVPERSGTPA